MEYEAKVIYIMFYPPKVAKFVLFFVLSWRIKLGFDYG
jgi:hypothetical protein